MKKEDKIIWIALRDNEPCNSFDSREDAVAWLKEVLKQELKDIEHQDKPHYSYDIHIHDIKIKKVDVRPTYLGS